jgi:hypothetical protein
MCDRPTPDLVDSVDRLMLDDEILGDEKVAVGGDRPTNLALGERAAYAELGQARWRNCIAASS